MEQEMIPEIRSEVDEMLAQFGYLKQDLEELEKERDFYYEKCKSVEIICQEEVTEPVDEIKDKILDILYATQDGFPAPDEEDNPVSLNRIFILPNELKMKIFDYFSGKERQNLREISKSWDTLISNMYTINIVFNNEIWENCLSSFAPSIHAYFRNFTFPIIQSVEGKSLPFQLTSLTFEGIIVSYNLIPLLEECINLQTLTFDKINGTPGILKIPFKFNLDESTKLLPALKYLKIIYKNENKNMIAILRKLKPFFGCGTEMSKLRTIDFQNESDNWRSEIPFSFPDDFLLDFYFILLGENRETLYKLRFSDKYGQIYYKLYPFIDGQNETSNAIVEKLDIARHISPLDFVSTICNLKKPVRQFSMFGRSNNGIGIILKIKCLNDLKILSIFYDENTPLGLISNDAISFTHLKNLQKLTILRDFEDLSLNRNLMNHWNNEFINFQYLPTTIRVLKLSSTIVFPHESNFNVNFFEKFMNLEIFELSAHCAHPWFRFGVTNCIYMNSDKILGLMNWMPNLMRLKLRSRYIPDWEFPMSPCTIQDCSIQLIKLMKGINVLKILVKTEDGDHFFQNPLYDYFFEISIQPLYWNKLYQIYP